ncbi:MAG: 9-O-acetylesterase [Sphingobacteriales bacterium]|nr:9-O-acetylesterase [Sphingobacteriales bacterium]
MTLFLNEMKKTIIHHCIIGLTLFCVFTIPTAIAAIKLPAIIGNNMVLQRGIKVPLWGWATIGEEIQISFQGKVFKTTADKEGKWFVKLSSYKAGGPFEMSLKSNESQIELKNILIGDVWVASGQSNMEFGIQNEKTGTEEIPKATDSQIHMFYVPMASALEPQKDIATVPAGSRNGQWIVCSPEAMADTKWSWHGFSAVGYYFAKELRSSTGSPVGMIATYKGGTPAQAWISLPGLQQAPAFSNYINNHQSFLDNYEKVKQEYPAKEATFQAAFKQWNLQQTGAKPQAPTRPDGGFSAPSNLYNAMVSPLVPYGIKGVIWYQGESNADKLPQALEYKSLFPRLISDWREKWGQGNFPFLYVQLANIRKPAETPSEGIWPWLREAQLKTLSVTKTGMAVITDIGEAYDIHPTNKKDVGIRMALIARKVAYKEKLVYSGPVYKCMKIKRNTVELSFENTGSGLVGNNPILKTNTLASDHLRGFGIAASDGKFVWADAVLKGNKIIVSSDKISKPVAVRYNWADNPTGTLYNQEGLPATPFRTDNFPANQ